MDKLLNPGLEHGHQLKPDIHQLVTAHDWLGVVPPALIGQKRHVMCKASF